MAILEMGRASAVTSSAQRGRVFQWTETLKQFLSDICSGLVQRARGLPMLRVYSSDCTPLRVRERLSSQHGPLRVVRYGGIAHDFLVQVSFTRYIDLSGEVHTAVKLSDPQPMERKTGWRLFSAMRAFQPTLRAEGHKGISINHLVCDRAQVSVLDRHFRELHSLEHQTMATDGEAESAVVLLNLKNWCVSSGCSCHDAHNSLKWALATYIGDSEFMKTIFVTVDSLRNSYCYLLQGLGLWLTSVVVFRDPPFSLDVLQLLWSVLGLEPSLTEELIDLQLLYHDGHLHVAPPLCQRS